MYNLVYIALYLQLLKTLLKRLKSHDFMLNQFQHCFFYATLLLLIVIFLHLAKLFCSSFIQS